MAHPRNRHQGKGKPDTSKVLVRVMSAMIGLSFGFAGGRFLAIPMAKAPVSGKAAAPAEAFSAPSMGAPLNERISAAFRMNEDGLRGVLAGIQDEWVKTSSSPSREAKAMLDLRVLFSRWTDLDGDGAVKAAIGIRDFQLSTLAIEAVMTEWGLRDSLAASQRVATIPSASGQQRGLAALVRAGVQKSPAEVLAMTSKLVLAPQNLLRSAAGAGWLRREASQALRSLREIPGMDSAVSTGGALGAWLIEDPEGFMAWHSGNPEEAKAMPRLHFPPEPLDAARFTRLRGVLQKVFGSTEAAAAWLKEAGNATAKPLTEQFPDPMEALAAEMKSRKDSNAASLPPETPAGWLTRIQHFRSLARLTARAAAEPEPVLDWLAGLPEAGEAAFLAPAAARHWLNQAPATAAPRLFAADLTNPARKAAAMVAVERMIVSDPIRFLGDPDKLPLDAAAAGSLRDKAFGQLAFANPPALLDWLAAHPGTAVPGDAVKHAVKRLAETDAGRALQWIQSSAPGETAASLTGEIFPVWLLHDRYAAVAFLESLPAGTGRDALIHLLAAADLEMKDGIFAANVLPESFVQALACSNHAGRTGILKRLLLRMKEFRISPGNLLNDPRLSPAERAALSQIP